MTNVLVGAGVVWKRGAEPGAPRMLRERSALELLGEATGSLVGGVAVPRLLSHGVDDGGHGWVAMTRVPGAPPAAAHLPGPDASPELAGGLGAFAAHLHRIEAPGFGTWRRDPGFTLLDEQRQRIAGLRDWLRTSTLVSGAEAAHLAAALAASTEALHAAPERSVLAHRDLHPRNVLVDREGRLSGVVDFEASGGSDPAQDFAAMAIDWSTPAFGAFRRGYEAAGGDLGPGAADRIAHFTLHFAGVILGRSGHSSPAYVAPARLAVERITSGERPPI